MQAATQVDAEQAQVDQRAVAQAVRALDGQRAVLLGDPEVVRAVAARLHAGRFARGHGNNPHAAQRDVHAQRGQSGRIHGVVAVHGVFRRVAVRRGPERVQTHAARQQADRQHAGRHDQRDANPFLHFASAPFLRRPAVKIFFISRPVQ